MQITEVDDTVVAIRGHDVNWTILRDGSSFTLVDAGYPRYAAAVRDSIRQIGLQMSGLRAVVVTHAHIDHIGGVPAVLQARKVPVYVGAPEMPMALGAWMEQASPLDIAKNMWKPRYVPWAVRIALAGGSAHVKVRKATGVEDGALLNIPGNPKVIHTPGHTSGHICLQVGDVVLTGDALITGHAVSGRTGPQLIAPVFHNDPEVARDTLSRLAELDASVIVPGHGPVWRGSMAEAVKQAKDAR